MQQKIKIRPTVQDFKSFFIEQRKTNKFTQVEIAGRAGLSQSVISKLETGESEATLETFFALVKAMGFEIELVKGR